MTAPSLNLPGFKVIEHVGAGGLGDVFVATRESTGGKVAIKLLRESAAPKDAERRIRREVEALLVLKGHPAVVQVEEILSSRHGPALVMEYAEDGSLLNQIESDGPLSTQQTAVIGFQISGLLVDAHRLGIIHRDIKPHNILRTAFGSYKVCDFGIASLARTEDWASQTSAVSYRYASPEDLEGDDVAGPSDVFSLGVTLVQARTGTTRQVRTADLVPPDTASPTDRQLGRLLKQMVAIDPGERPTAEQCRDELDQIRRAPAPSNASSGDATTVVRPTRDDTPTSTPGLPAPTSDDEWWNP